jgi:hypothetical protein
VSEHRLDRTRPQHVDARRLRQHRGHHGHDLEPCIRPPRSVAPAHLAVDELPQPQHLRESRGEEAGVGHGVVLVEGNTDPVEIVP